MEKNGQLFYDKLKDIFIGAKIEGNSGFVNLMKIKSSYFDVVFKELKKEIDEKLKEFPDFKEEMYGKLNTFFSTYFSESGSIYFTYTPLKSKIYDEIYTDQDDVILFWKTRKLYYAKTDKIWNNLTVEYDKDGVKYKIYFDVSKLEHKSGNEKKEIIYELNKINTNEISCYVYYSEKGRKTDIDDIIKKLKENKIYLNEEDIEKIFKIFEKQNEVDYFINKDAKIFLREQFDLWLKNYVFDEGSDFSEKRIKELKTLKEIAYKIIDFVSQFEDELVKIWNKPKFVLNSNYVVTLDRIANKNNGIEIIKNILNHKGIDEQIKEWKDLGIIDDSFDKKVIIQKTINGETLNPKYKFLPMDTKYFKDLELDILSLFDNLDRELDGWLIHSENYQALNTILPKFKEKVQTIYIDPPFNTGNGDFDYIDRFQDSSWLSLMNDRISLAKQFLKNSGSIFVHLDHNAEHLGRILLDSIFKNGFINNLAWSYRTGGASKKTSLPYKHDSILFFAKDIENFTYKPIYERQYLEKPFIGAKQDKEGKYYTDTLLRDVVDGVIKDFVNKKVFNTRPVLNLSNEFYGFKTQKPEGLLYLLQYITSKSEKEIILDFFAGLGTSLAVAQKLNKKWIGIEMGEHIDNFYIGDIELNKTEKNRIDLYKKFVVLDYKEEESKIKAKVKKNGILGRLKQVLSARGKNEPCGITEDINWQGGGFFKYYDLEQYEQTLRKCRYMPSEPFPNLDNKTIYEQYIFLKDPKLLDAMELDYKNNKIKINFDEIYPNIDIAETLSNLKGKWIKKIAKDSVVLLDDNGNEEEIEYDDIKSKDFKIIKPLIWW